MPSRGRRPLFLALTALMLFVLSLLGDRALGLFGFPGEAPEFVYPVAPPHYAAEVDNVEFRYTLRTNSRGIRSPETPLKKPAGVRRIVLLGDSFVEGAGVADGERWSDLLGDALNRRPGCSVEIINCGESGAGPDDYLRTLDRACIAYEPDVVLIGLFYNDVKDTPPGVTVDQVLATSVPRTGLKKAAHALWPHVYTLLRERLGVGRLPDDPDALEETLIGMARDKGIEESAIERWRREVPRERLEAVAAGRMYPSTVSQPLLDPMRMHRALDLEGEYAAARWKTIRELLSEIVRIARAAGAQAAAVYFPDRIQYQEESFSGWRARMDAAFGHPYRREWLSGTSRLETAFAQWAAEEGVASFNMTADMRRARAEIGESLTHPIDGHWRAAGQRAAAESLERALTQGSLRGVIEGWGCEELAAE